MDLPLVQMKVLYWLMQNTWEQIDKPNISHNELFSKSKTKNALRGLAFNVINFEGARIFRDFKKITVI